jgi:CBS-domain-containing membrane protein
MSSPVLTANKNIDTYTAYNLFEANKIRHLVVVDHKNRAVGVVTQSDMKVKVLLSSGYSIDGEATEILERGCKSFIQKPFMINVLVEKIRDILNNK